ncbi:MAG: Bug family tripartite tricarboxylate transporter substrate binding protein [bacterium]|nr:tripartite tricarboxylate transporter substrate binding protein [Betaproteobacteria bacterium]
MTFGDRPRDWSPSGKLSNRVPRVPRVHRAPHVLAAGAFLLAGAASGPLQAQGGGATAWPTKPLRIIVGFLPGGGSDLIARTIGQRLSDRLGQPLLVDNRPGAGGSIGTEIAVRATPDGYTLLLGSTSGIAINPWVYTLAYDPVRDLLPVAMVASTPMVAVVTPSLPAKTLGELVELARAKPKQLNYASVGIGTILHLAGELFRMHTGTDLVHVPYEGSPPALADVATGQVQLMFATVPAAMPMVKANRVRPLAVSAIRRNPTLPDVPTVVESGVPGYPVEHWYALFAPSGVAAPVVSRLQSEVQAIVKTPDYGASLLAQGFDAPAIAPKELPALVKSEAGRWGKAVKVSGAKVEQ